MLKQQSHSVAVHVGRGTKAGVMGRPQKGREGAGVPLPGVLEDPPPCLLFSQNRPPQREPTAENLGCWEEATFIPK